MNPFLQLAAEIKDSKNGAARKYFGPSYFVTAIVGGSKEVPKCVDVIYGWYLLEAVVLLTNKETFEVD